MENINEDVTYELDLVKTESDMELKLKNSDEVAAIAKQIDTRDLNSILKYGNETASEISKFSDQILHTMENTKVEDSGNMLLMLNKIMDKFDIKDFEEKNQI